MDFSIISFIAVLFIALCAAIYLWSNRARGLIAGESINRGSLVAVGTDGKVYKAKPYDLPLGICIEELL